MFSVSVPKPGRRFVWMLLAVGCFAAVALAQDAGNCTVHDVSTRPDCPSAIAFFQKLQIAVRAGNKAQLASMVNYPLRAGLSGKKIQIRTRTQFLKDYAKLFTPGVVCAITSAKDSEVWGNYQGFMIGKGVIWWDQIIPVIPASIKDRNVVSSNYPFKIITINNEDVMVPGCEH
jgi:hypothetical protein